MFIKQLKKETKNFIYKSPLIKFVKDVEAQIQYLALLNAPSEWQGKRTVYSISPYKTGTTFLATSFNRTVSQHEPMQYLSLKLLDKDFNKFFVKRLNKLNLNLECSPYFSAYIEQLADHEIASEFQYLCILRKPSAWITSVINFYNRPETLAMNYEYENELFWKPKVGVDNREFKDGQSSGDKMIISKLIEFYFDFTLKTKKLKNVHYIHLNELESKMTEIGKIIDSVPDYAKRWKRENKYSLFTYQNLEIDEKYQELISQFQLL